MKIDIKKLRESSNKLEGNCSGVYFLFENEDLVYIGKGWNCFLRVAEHTRKESDKVFTSWNYMYVEDDKERSQLESELIRTFKPKFNKRNC